MCMKNVSTNIIFYKKGYRYLHQRTLVDLVGATKMPEVEIERIDGDKDHVKIKELDFALLINAINHKENDSEKKTEKIDPKEEMLLSEEYEIVLRLSETSSGECIDLEHIYIRPREEKETCFSLCREIYTKLMHFSFGDVKVATPPKGKDLCVLKVLIKNKNSQKDEWFIQSMHPIKMKLN